MKICKKEGDQFWRAVFKGSPFFFIVGRPLPTPRRPHPLEVAFPLRNKGDFEARLSGGNEGRWGGQKKDTQKVVKRSTSGFVPLGVP